LLVHSSSWIFPLPVSSERIRQLPVHLEELAIDIDRTLSVTQHLGLGCRQLEFFLCFCLYKLLLDGGALVGVFDQLILNISDRLLGRGFAHCRVLSTDISRVTDLLNRDAITELNLGLVADHNDSAAVIYFDGVLHASGST